MKQIKLFGVPVLSFGDIPNATDKRGVPVATSRFLAPRYEPSNVTQNITTAEIQDYIRQAENGQTFNLYRFYRDVLLSDNHIQGKTNTRKLALLAQPLTIMPKDKNNPDDVALAAAVIRMKEDCANWRDGMIALLDSNCGWPVSIVEKIFRAADQARPGEPQLIYTLKKFVPVNHQLLCYQWAYLMGGIGLGIGSAIQQANVKPDLAAPDANNPYIIDLECWEPYIKLWPIDAAGRIIYDTGTASYLDPMRHIAHRGHLMTTFRDNWGGPMRSLAMWWFLRNRGRDIFARFMGRYGNPFPVGYTDAKDAEAVRLLNQAFDEAQDLFGLVVDESSRVELIQASIQGGAEGHKIFHDLCNDEISMQLTGMDSSSKPAGLNAGENQMQQGVREDYRVFDQQSLAETVIQQLVVPFRDMNGLKGMVKLVWGGLSDTDAATFAGFLNVMKQAGWTPTDDAIPTIEDRTGIPFERAEVPAPVMPGKAPGAPKPDDEEKTFSASRLTWLSASASMRPTPVDPIVSKHSAALAQAFRGSLAPVRQIILNSASRADAEHQLRLFFADWKPDRIAAIVEEALQVCAATGAAKATENK